MNWINLLIYLGMFIISAIMWYFIVFYVMDWLGLW